MRSSWELWDAKEGGIVSSLGILGGVCRLQGMEFQAEQRTPERFRSGKLQMMYGSSQMMLVLEGVGSGVGKVRLLEVARARASSTPGKGTFWTGSHVVRSPESIARGTQQNESPWEGPVYQGRRQQGMVR